MSSVTYTDVFGNQTVPPAGFAYRAVALAADTTFFWPQLSDGDDLMAIIMDVSASSTYAMTFPDAMLVSTGQDVLIRNTGANTITVKDSAGGTITTIAAGIVKYFYLTDNSTAAGSWTGFTFGTGTSSADANDLAGYGLTVITGDLALEHPTVSSSVTYAVQSSDRAKVVVFSSSGAVTCTVPSAATVGDGFFFMVSNQGSGTVTATNGADDIDGASTKAIAPTESLLLVTDGGEWYSVGYGRGTTFAFTQLVKDVTAAGSFTLSASEYANKLMRFIGAPAAAVTIIVPAVANVYYVQNAYSGAETMTFKTAAGTGVTLTGTDRVILLCDGTDVVLAQSTTVSAPTGIPDGTAAAPALYFTSDTNTGIFRAGTDTFGIAGNGVEFVRFGTAEALFATAINVDAAAKSTTRTNLGLAIGTDVQAYDAELAAIAGLTSAADKLPYFTGSGTAALTDLTAAGRALLDDANAAAQLVTLGAQPADALLTSLAAQTVAANKVQAYSGVDTASLLDFKDEDNMASDSATAVPSQQSVKAYVDNSFTTRFQSVISYTGTGGITAKGAVLTKTPCTVIPRDDTLPQNTEGDAILDVTITPSVAGAVIEVDFQVSVENESGANEVFVVALFRDTTADAEYVVPMNIIAGFALAVHGSHRITAANTTPITFKLRGGTATAQNLSYNSGSAATYGAVMNGFIKATEVGYT